MRSIPGFPGYLAGEDGHIYSVFSGRRQAEHVGSSGYIRAWAGTSMDVHRLIALAYCSRTGPIVRHLDGDRYNNLPGNLAWGTYRDNAADRERHGRTSRGATRRTTKLTDSAIHEICRRIDAGECLRHIAREFYVSPGMIGHIKHGRKWRHVCV